MKKFEQLALALRRGSAMVRDTRLFWWSSVSQEWVEDKTVRKSTIVDALAKNVADFEKWKHEVDVIAAAEGLYPKRNPGYADVEAWRSKWAAGMEPKQAWDFVPYGS